MDSSSEVLLHGVVGPGRKWVTANWEDVCEAHRYELPEIADFFPGTLNIDLTDPQLWSPPRDEELRMEARCDGRNREIGIRLNGNYVHPDCQVVEFNGIPVEAWLYYPGVSSDVWPWSDTGQPQPLKRPRIELLSRDHLRTRFPMLNDGTLVTVKLSIHI